MKLSSNSSSLPIPADVAMSLRSHIPSRAEASLMDAGQEIRTLPLSMPIGQKSGNVRFGNMKE